MNKTLTKLAVTGLVIAGAAAPALAQSQGQMNQGQQGSQMQPAPGQSKVTVQQGPAMPASETRQVTITVQKVDPATHRVWFEAQVRPEAGGAVRIDSLKPGQQVRATFDPNTGDIISLQAMSAPPASGSSGSGSGY